MRSQVIALWALEATRLRARWRAALGTARAAGAAAAGVSDLLAALLLLVASSGLGLVGALTAGALAATGDAAGAALVASRLADAGLVLGVLAAVFDEPRRDAAGRRATALLPVRPSALALAEGAAFAFARPTALVAWPVSLSLLAGAARAGTGAGMVPAAAGLLALISAAALLATRAAAWARARRSRL
ncbi:MAG: hypothetical protein D6718_13510, partial [Acidobacteria bacterium]